MPILGGNSTEAANVYSVCKMGVCWTCSDKTLRAWRAWRGTCAAPKPRPAGAGAGAGAALTRLAPGNAPALDGALAVLSQPSWGCRRFIPRSRVRAYWPSHCMNEEAELEL
jgi:hypothetical protein